MQQKLIDLLQKKDIFRIKAFGNSMLPTFRAQDLIYIKKMNRFPINVDDIVFVKNNKRFFIHRVIYIKNDNNIITKGDNDIHPDKKIKKSNIVGKVIAFQRDNKIRLINELYENQSKIYLQEIINFVTQCRKNKINYVFLKGWPIHLTDKKRYTLRIYADCDILLQESSATFINKYFADHFYHKQNIGMTRLQFSKSFGEFVVTFYVNYRINIVFNQYGFFENLFLVNSKYSLEEIFLQNKVYTLYKRQHYSVLSPTYLVVYLCLHFFHFNFKELYRLRIIADCVSIYSGKKQAEFFAELSGIINSLHIKNITYPTFVLLKKYYDCKIPNDFMEKVTPSKAKLEYISKYIIHKEVAYSEFRLAGFLNRLRNIFFLSSISYYQLIIIILKIPVIYFRKLKISNLL